MTEHNLYHMPEGHSLCREGYDVLRVPGGWIYTIYCSNNISSCFVPFNDEFKVPRAASEEA